MKAAGRRSETGARKDCPVEYSVKGSEKALHLPVSPLVQLDALSSTLLSDVFRQFSSVKGLEARGKRRCA